MTHVLPIHTQKDDLMTIEDYKLEYPALLTWAYKDSFNGVAMGGGGARVARALGIMLRGGGMLKWT